MGESEKHRVNNCYNYAMRNYTDTFAQPGRSKDIHATNKTCARLNKNISLDIEQNGRQVKVEESCQEGEWKVCGFLAVNNSAFSRLSALWSGFWFRDEPLGKDYHFYRQDGPDEWSHKRGGNIPTSLDAEGNEIKDVITANRKYNDHAYERLCGCYCVNDKVTIK